MEVLQHPLLKDPTLWMVVVGIIVLLVVMFYWLRFLARRKFENQLVQIVKNIAVDYQKDVYLPDGLGESVYIHYMILSHYGITILSVQNYPGILFGGDNIDLWTQINNKKSYKFENPLHYYRICMQSVKQIIPGVEIHGHVVFTHAGEFPKGKPEGVCLSFELLKEIESLPRMDVIPESVQQAWDKLKAASSSAA